MTSTYIIHKYIEVFRAYHNAVVIIILRQAAFTASAASTDTQIT